MKDGGKLKQVDLLLLPLEELRDQVLELDRDEAGLLVAGLVGHVLGDLRKRQKVEVEVERHGLGLEGPGRSFCSR